jgi:hypothetical protein
VNKQNLNLARRRHHVAGVQKLQHGAERVPSLGRGAAPLLGPDDLTMVPLPEPLPDASGILVRPTKTATGCEFEAASETGRVM